MNSETKKFLSHFKGGHRFSIENKEGGFYTRGFNEWFDEWETGYNVYFTVNATDGVGRKAHNITEIRSVWADDDNIGKLRTAWPIPPSAIVQSSAGKYHYYWFTTTPGNATDIDEWNGVQDGIAQMYDTDEGAIDLARILRVPGTENIKYTPVSRCNLVELNGQVYGWDEILKAFPPVPQERRAKAVLTSNGKLDDNEAVRHIKEGLHFSDPLNRLIMSWANKHTDEVVLGKVAELYHLAPEGNRRNLAFKQAEKWLNSAKAKINKGSNMKITNLVKQQEAFKKDTEVPELDIEGAAPTFPKDVVKDWPAPWPQLWASWSKLPRTLVPELLFPTFIAAHAHMLKGLYKTEVGRNINMSMLNLSPSTGGKDINSKDVLVKVHNIMMKECNGVPFSPFYFFIQLMTGVTSDSAFYKMFAGEKKGEAGNELFMLFNEGTSFYQQLADKSTNSAINALSYRLIDADDGFVIGQKGKAQEKFDTIVNPVVQSIVYAQPKTIRDYITEDMVDSGFFGRQLIFIPPEGRVKSPMFQKPTVDSSTLPPEIVAFYKDLPTLLPREAKCVEMSAKQYTQCSEWADKSVMPKIKSELLETILVRLGIPTEKFYTLIFAFAELWAKHNDIPTPYVNVAKLFPLMDYLADTKVYSVKHLLVADLDPLASGVLDMIKRVLNGKPKLQGKYAAILNKEGFAPIPGVLGKICSDTTLKKKLSINGDTKNVRDKAKRVIKEYVAEGVLIEKEIEGTPCVAYAK